MSMPLASISATWSPEAGAPELADAVRARSRAGSTRRSPERKYQLLPSAPRVISIPYGSTIGSTDSGWKWVWTLMTGSHGVDL